MGLALVSMLLCGSFVFLSEVCENASATESWTSSGQSGISWSSAGYDVDDDNDIDNGEIWIKINYFKETSGNTEWVKTDNTFKAIGTDHGMGEFLIMTEFNPNTWSLSSLNPKCYQNDFLYGVSYLDNPDGISFTGTTVDWKRVYIDGDGDGDLYRLQYECGIKSVEHWYGEMSSCYVDTDYNIDIDTENYTWGRTETVST